MAQEVPHSYSPQDALVAVMVAASASDERMTDPEVDWISRIIDSLPIFVGYDKDRVGNVSSSVFDLFEEVDGLDALFGLIEDALPEALMETAYALACDVVAADGQTRQQELRLLEEFRMYFNLDRLHASAIERGARARFARMQVE